LAQRAAKGQGLLLCENVLSDCCEWAKLIGRNRSLVLPTRTLKAVEKNTKTHAHARTRARTHTHTHTHIHTHTHYLSYPLLPKQTDKQMNNPAHFFPSISSFFPLFVSTD
jgi:hypothetical protein